MAAAENGPVALMLIIAANIHLLINEWNLIIFLACGP